MDYLQTDLDIAEESECGFEMPAPAMMPMTYRVDGHESPDVGNLVEESDEALGSLVTKDWYAWVNGMLPGPRRLHVGGNITLASPSYAAELVPHAPGAGTRGRANENKNSGGHSNSTPNKASGSSASDRRVLELNLEIRRREGMFPRVVITDPVCFASKRVGGVERVRIHLPKGEPIELEVLKTL